MVGWFRNQYSNQKPPIHSITGWEVTSSQKLGTNINYFYPSYIFAILIFILSSLPGEKLTKIQQYPDNAFLQFFLSDPMMHWGVSAVLSALLCYGFYQSGTNPIPLGKIVLLGIGYVLFIEIYQAILPWRSFGFDDILWGSIGMVSVPVLVKFI